MIKLFIPAVWLVALLLSGLANAQTCTNTAMEQSTPTSSFTFSSDGKTATNTATGLTWKRCLEGQTFSDNGTPSNYFDDQCTGTATIMNWQAALNQAQTASDAMDSDYNDWRVPNFKELRAIVEHCRENPAINTDIFPSGNINWVWSSSPVTYFGYESYILGVSFNSGYDFWFDHSGRAPWNSDSFDFHVRLVRSSQ